MMHFGVGQRIARKRKRTEPVARQKLNLLCIYFIPSYSTLYFFFLALLFCVLILLLLYGLTEIHHTV